MTFKIRRYNHEIFHRYKLAAKTPRLAVGSSQDQMLRHLVATFRNLYLFDLSLNRIQCLDSNYHIFNETMQDKKIRVGVQDFADRYIHRDDTNRFMKHFDPANLLNALHKSKEGMLVDLFKVESENGDYTWTKFIALLVEENDEEGENIFVIEQRALLEVYDQPAIINKQYVHDILKKKGLHD